jgi:hypothetical protein
VYHAGPERPFSYAEPQEPPGYPAPPDPPASAGMGASPGYNDAGPGPAYADQDPVAEYGGPGGPPVYRDPEPVPAYGAPGSSGDYRSAEEPAAYDDGSGNAPAESGYGDVFEAGPYALPGEADVAVPAEPVRGPFEPHPGQPRPGEPEDGGLGGDTAPLAQMSGAAPAWPDGAALPGGTASYDDAGDEAAGEGSGEKLEQIKDLYLTVEAIGDDNVDKHFDELMRRQRELISDYFKETGIGSGQGGAGQNGNSADGM